VSRPEDLPAELRFRGIWSNPPIRVGKDVLHEILQTWLPRLEDSAEGYLVVQKNLGADSLHRWLEDEMPDGFSTIRVETAKGFRVLRVKNRG
jgi:16S rRNA G1207 methylase RsmC